MPTRRSPKLRQVYSKSQSALGTLDAEKMKECGWVKPTAKVQVAFVEWTEVKHLRHSRYVGLG